MELHRYEEDVEATPQFHTT